MTEKQQDLNKHFSKRNINTCKKKLQENGNDNKNEIPLKYISTRISKSKKCLYTQTKATVIYQNIFYSCWQKNTFL